MELFLRIVLIAHVTIGFIGLAAFWVPIVTRKGGINHRRFGKIFKNCAYLVFGTAGLAVVLSTIQYLAAGHTLATRPSAFGSLIFLGYLAFATFVIVRHGVGVLEHKKDPTALATPMTKWLARGTMLASLLVVIFALVVAPPNKLVLLSLSPLGLLSGLGILRYIGKPAASPKAWLYEHLGSMIGSGIAFHTAFAVVGINRLFNIGLEGWVAVIPWIAPAFIGTPAIIIWARYYRRRFGELA